MLLREIIAIFVGVFLAEIGDKTQLGTLTIAIKTRNIYKTIILSMSGLILATIVSIIIGYIIGYIFSQIVLEKYVAPLSGVIFIVLGLMFLLIKQEENIPEKSTAIITMFLLELGDKTQISIITFTILFGNPIIVLIVSTIAFLLVVLLTATLGSKFAERIPQEKLKYASAIFFMIIGAMLLVSYFL